MGECFLYVNIDRREYFLVNALGGALKSSGVGRNLGARALGLLLLREWAGDRVAVVGDEADRVNPKLRAEMAPEGGAEESLFAAIEGTYRNIDSAIALLLLRQDGAATIAGAAKESDELFVILGELALIHHVEEVARALHDEVGPDWKKRFGEKRRVSMKVVLPPWLGADASPHDASPPPSKLGDRP